MKLFKYLPLLLCMLISSCSHAEQREIKSSDFMKDLKSGKSITVVNKIILDNVDFTSTENYQILGTQLQNVIEGNISFVNCVFMSDVTALGKKDNASVSTIFNNNLQFVNCDFRGTVTFDNAVVMGTTNFNKAKFLKPASFNNMTIWAKDSYFSEIEAEDNVSFIYSSFYGNLYIMDGKFKGDFSLQNALVNGKLLANGLQCSKAAEFDMSSIRGRAIFNYSTFEKQASFIQARFFDDADFVETNFSESANLEGTYFFGKLNMGDKFYPCNREMKDLMKY